MIINKEMSSLWKKFRGGTANNTTDQSPGAVWQHQDGPTATSCDPELLHSGLGHLPSTHHLITKADEQLFLNSNEVNGSDPLLVQSQFVKTVHDILHSPATLPYFLQFLQGWGADKYARFWLDANSFRAATVTRVAVKEQAPPPAPAPRPTTLTVDVNTLVRETDGNGKSAGDVGRLDASQPGKQTHSKDLVRDLVLPDLVSNIKYANDVTPLGSPEGVTPDALTCHTRPLDKERLQGHRDDQGSSVKESHSAQGDAEQCHPPSAAECSPRARKLQRGIADDALTIFNRYLARDAEHWVGVDEGITEDISRRISAVHEDIDPNCFLPAQEAVFGVLEKEYLPKFLASDYYLKHQIDVLTSGSVRLADIIYSDSAFPYFMEYMEQEGGKNILQLWVAVSNFRQQLLEAEAETYDPAQAQADAMILYEKYFSLQATCPQGFTDAVRFLIEVNICREPGPLPSCFDLPLRVVLHVLERDFLPGYLSSSLHINYLGELINTVKTSVELLSRKKRTGSESTCSSEQSSGCGGGGGSVVSISSQNTLLAMDSSAAAACRLRNLADPSLAMRIDESQLNDPDSLWRRKNFSKLSCGFVNELGRFEAEIELHPDHRAPSSRLQKIRRLMGREEDKVKEDLAYQVAEMVIKDVTRVTLGAKAEATSRPPPPQPS